jgi:hypothetical protein
LAIVEIAIMTLLIVIRLHLQAIRIKELGDRRDLYHDSSDRHHADPTCRHFVLKNLAIVVIAFISIQIVIPPPPVTCVHFLMKEIAIVVIAIIASNIFVTVTKG